MYLADSRIILHPQDEKSLELLLNHAFGVPRGGSFWDDFPIWQIGARQGVLRLGAFSGDLLASTASLRTCTLRFGDDLLPVGVIGAVTTQPQYQGQGLATRLVAELTVRAEKAGLAALFLWSSEFEFYGRLGFELAGTQVRMPLDRVPASKESAVIQTGWTPKIMQSLFNRPQGLVIQPSDQPWIEAHRNVMWYWIDGPSALKAYAAVGRGIDLQGIVHEWGGEAAALNQILRSLDPQTHLIGSPSLIQERAWDAQGAISEYLCLAKVLRPDVFSLERDFWLWGLDGA